MWSTWPIRTCNVTYSYVWRDSFACVARRVRDKKTSYAWIHLVCVCDLTHSYVWRDSFTCKIWLVHMCDMTHSYVRHDSFICVLWLTHRCAKTHSYVRHDFCICQPWLIRMCDMHDPYEWHVPCLRVLGPITYVIQFTTHCNTLQHTATHSGRIHTCDAIHTYAWRNTFCRETLLL